MGELSVSERPIRYAAPELDRQDEDTLATEVRHDPPKFPRAGGAGPGGAAPHRKDGQHEGKGYGPEPHRYSSDSLTAYRHGTLAPFSPGSPLERCLWG